MKLPLFPYQEAAKEVFLERKSLLLAFDTGVGKTATAIGIAEELLETRAVRKVLVVVPASLKFQWARSLARFTDLPTTTIKVKGETVTIPSPESCVIIDGTPERRAKQYAQARVPEVEYIVIGYDQVVDEWKKVRALGCEFVVLDEASALKNITSKRSKAIKRHYKTVPYRLGLTATPIENRPEEVFSLMQFIDEDVLGRYDLFDRAYIRRDQFGGVQGYLNLDILAEKLEPVMIRKTRFDEDVAGHMPGVSSGVWAVEMDEPTSVAYKKMLADLLAAYDEVGPFAAAFDVHRHYGHAKDDRRGDKTSLGRLMSIHGVMEQLLDHPELIRESARLYETTDDRGSKYASDLVASGYELPGHSPKLAFLMDEVLDILDQDPGTKILIFTRFKLMLRLIEKEFADADIGVTLYDGDMVVKAKEASIQRFKTNPECRVFLSSHAGAFGTDLPEASWLIHYDLAWGAGVHHQISGRHVRASSEHDVVHVRSMVTEGTIESRKHQTLSFKGSISDAVVDRRARKSGQLENDVQSLKSHAEEVLGLTDFLD